MLITFFNICTVVLIYGKREGWEWLIYNEDIGDVEFEGDTCDGGFIDYLLRFVD